MNPDTIDNETTALVPVDPNNNALVPIEQTDDRDEIKVATEALIAAIQKRANAEMEGAMKLVRSTYLGAVEQARHAVEGKPILDGDRLEPSMQAFQKQADRSLIVLAAELESIGIRLADLVRTSWKSMDK